MTVCYVFVIIQIIRSEKLIFRQTFLFWKDRELSTFENWIKKTHPIIYFIWSYVKIHPKKWWSVKVKVWEKTCHVYLAIINHSLELLLRLELIWRNISLLCVDMAEVAGTENCPIRNLKISCLKKIDSLWYNIQINILYIRNLNMN